MSRKSKSSIFGWAAAVTVPLVVLAYVAALGIRGQKEAARTRAQEEAAVIAASQAEPFSRKLLAGIEEFPRFPDPPVPGGKSSFDDQLDGTDLTELIMVRDNPDAGISPAGLPRRALAALRIDALFPEEQDMSELADLLMREAPSVLTVPALKRLHERQPGFEIPAVWRLMNQLDEIRPDHPDGGWITFEKEVWWIAPDARRFLPPAALSTAALETPPHAAARLS